MGSFPRHGGKAITHCIPVEVVNIRDLCLLREKDIEASIEYIADTEGTLVYGDAVVYESLHCPMSGNQSTVHGYFDGITIIPAERLCGHADCKGCLPERFRVINESVPIDYWDNNGCPWVRFDHRERVVDLICNVRYGQIGTQGLYAMYTQTHIENKIFTIVLSPGQGFHQDMGEEARLGFKDEHLQVMVLHLRKYLEDLETPLLLSRLSYIYPEQSDRVFLCCPMSIRKVPPVVIKRNIECLERGKPVDSVVRKYKKPCVQGC